MHILYVFFLQFTYKRVQTVQACLGTLERFVQSCTYSKSWTPDDERNSRSKHVELYVNCRKNIYRKCILLVCLYNWLRCTVHRTSNLLFSYSWKLGSVIEHNTVLNEHFRISSGCVLLFRDSDAISHSKDRRVIMSDNCKFNEIRIPCNRLIIPNLIQLTAQSVIYNFCCLRSSYLFRPLNVIIREVYTKAHKSSKFCQRCAHLSQKLLHLCAFV